jgi:hypothetical protein
MIDKIDAWQVFWSLLTALVSYIAFMITLFRKELKEVKTETNQRVLIVMCDKYRIDCEKECTKSREQRDKFIEKLHEDSEEACDQVHRELLKTAHSHATVGSAGEVVR